MADSPLPWSVHRGCLVVVLADHRRVLVPLGTPVLKGISSGSRVVVNGRYVHVSLPPPVLARMLNP